MTTRTERKPNRTIEELVKRGFMSRENAGRYYEEKGNYRNAIEHYRANTNYEKAFDLALKINDLEIAQNIMKDLSGGIDYAKRQLERIARENMEPDSEYGSAIGRFYNACAHRASEEGLAGLRIKLQTKLNRAQQPNQK